MHMTVFEWIMVYAVCWWMVLFMLLPFGVRLPEVVEDGAYPSAPVEGNIKKKALISTVISIPISAIIGWIIYNRAIVQWLESFFV